MIPTSVGIVLYICLIYTILGVWTWSLRFKHSLNNELHYLLHEEKSKFYKCCELNPIGFGPIMSGLSFFLLF